MTPAEDVEYTWHDGVWMESRGERCQLDKPISIYEVHLGSWRRVPEENNRPLTYAEIAPKLANYVRRMHFTHVEFLSDSEALDDGFPQALAYLIDYLHQGEVGVILDRGPSLLPSKEAIKNAQTFHADGLRAGAQTALLGVETGCNLKWDVHWTRHTLDYFGQDPIYRKVHHDLLTARSSYAFAENFILPLSHEEVTRGQGSLLRKVPGDEWQRFAHLRLLFAWMMAQPGKKLLFMGGEFGQWNEWNDATSLDWHLVQEGSLHAQLQRWVAELNAFYRREAALHQTDANPAGFEWVDRSDAECSTLSWLRYSTTTEEVLLAVFNFTPVPRPNYRVGVPRGGFWREMLNSDAREYGGSGQGNLGGVEAAPFGWHFQSRSLTITLPPLGAVFFKTD